MGVTAGIPLLASATATGNHLSRRRYWFPHVHGRRKGRASPPQPLSSRRGRKGVHCCDLWLSLLLARTTTTVMVGVAVGCNRCSRGCWGDQFVASVAGSRNYIAAVGTASNSNRCMVKSMYANREEMKAFHRIWMLLPSWHLQDHLLVWGK